MTVPNYPDKYDAEACLAPEDHLGAGADLPGAVVLTYQGDFFERVVAEHGGEELVGARSFSVHPLAGTDGRVGVAGEFGIGGPMTAAVVEALVARGTEAVCIVGGCGALGRALDSGEAVLADRAVRDEGASHHYLPPERYVHADEALVAELADSLDAAGRPYRVGPTWTTDAIYRETYPEVEHYAGEGVLAVEMEAATAFAVARYRGVDAAALLVPHDRVTVDGWIPPDDPDGGLDALLEPARDALKAHLD